MNLPRLYAILDAGQFPDTARLLAAAEELVAGGVTLLQYRNKRGDARQMLEQARELRKCVESHPKVAKSATLGWGSHKSGWGSHKSGWDRHKSGWDSHESERGARSIKFIMNDRADLCLAAGFDGLHVGQDDLSAESARRIIGADRWLGVSTHNPEQLTEADKTSADYVAIGPVFQTSTKENPDPVVGLEGVRRARELTRKPLVAIGGITRSNARSVIDAGADAVAVISDLVTDPRKSAEEFLAIIR